MALTNSLYQILQIRICHLLKMLRMFLLWHRTAVYNLANYPYFIPHRICKIPYLVSPLYFKFTKYLSLMDSYQVEYQNKFVWVVLKILVAGLGKV